VLSVQLFGQLAKFIVFAHTSSVPESLWEWVNQSDDFPLTWRCQGQQMDGITATHFVKTVKSSDQKPLESADLPRCRRFWGVL
jgi:hypothetical protein